MNDFKLDVSWESPFISWLGTIINHTIEGRKNYQSIWIAKNRKYFNDKNKNRLIIFRKTCQL